MSNAFQLTETTLSDEVAAAGHNSSFDALVLRGSSVTVDDSCQPNLHKCPLSLNITDALSIFHGQNQL